MLCYLWEKYGTAGNKKGKLPIFFAGLPQQFNTERYAYVF